MKKCGKISTAEGSSYLAQMSRPDRKTIEKKRRTQMKDLCFQLASLIPLSHHNNNKHPSSQQDRLDFAAAYIKQLREKIKELEWTKNALAANDLNVTPNDCGNNSAGDPIMSASSTAASMSRLPIVELRDFGSTIEVTLITGLIKNFTLYEVVSLLEQEGAEVVGASFSTVGDKMFHSLHAQAKISRVGIETSRVGLRLQELIHQRTRAVSV